MRKDMPFHENDAGTHIGGLLDSLLTAQAKITELDKDKMIDRRRISILEQRVASQAKDAAYTTLISKVPVSKLAKSIDSEKINVNGFTFQLCFEPDDVNLLWHSMYLYLKEGTSMSLPLGVEAFFQIVSHNIAVRPTIELSFEHTYNTFEGIGFEKVMKTDELRSVEFNKDGFITLKAEISIKS
mmetsp:Transcript_32737/g.31202  ORF Transcript_32737/g.31202 Transcript_32737/m.31202 type:complete len:184 (-) Transcript_32737:250-801(-)